MEAIKDIVVRFDRARIQDLIAGLLRSMGYKATIWRQEPNRGSEILASPDGFGSQEPRIAIEVKHRGGFTTDAIYEAERAGIPLASSLHVNGSIAAIIENCPSVEEMRRQLLAPRTIYWPGTR